MSGKSPGFTAAAVATLALGIAACPARRPRRSRRRPRYFTNLSVR